MPYLPQWITFNDRLLVMWHSPTASHHAEGCCRNLDQFGILQSIPPLLFSQQFSKSFQKEFFSQQCHRRTIFGFPKEPFSQQFFKEPFFLVGKKNIQEPWKKPYMSIKKLLFFKSEKCLLVQEDFTNNKVAPQAIKLKVKGGETSCSLY